MQHVYVRALPGRAAFTAPSGGKRIPNDTFILCQLTPWIAGLIHKHGDVEARNPDENGDLPSTPPAAAEPSPDLLGEPAPRRPRKASPQSESNQ